MGSMDLRPLRVRLGRPVLKRCAAAGSVAADMAAAGNAMGTPRGQGRRRPQSSRSLRLGVRLGSLARKPKTKIPMKKKTTE